jgi:hypothetical protein
MVADVAMKVVSMLNDYTASKIKYSETLNDFSKGCLACHGPEKDKGDVSANMSCNTCHENPH